MLIVAKAFAPRVKNEQLKRNAARTVLYGTAFGPSFHALNEMNFALVGQAAVFPGATRDNSTAFNYFVDLY